MVGWGWKPYPTEGEVWVLFRPGRMHLPHTLLAREKEEEKGTVATN